MSDYTKLKGITNSQNSTITNILLDNFISFYDWGYLDKGAYYNVKRPLSNNVTNRARLSPLKSPNHSDGALWQSGRKNWVWESGVSIGTPISISGVYINNNFRPLDNTFRIDYLNGTLTFFSPLPLNSVVEVEHSHKWIDFVPANGIPFFREIQQRASRIENAQFAQHGSGNWAQLGETRVQLPTVAIEVVPPKDGTPFELSGGQWVHNDVIFYVITENDWECSNIMDQIWYQNDRAIHLYDPNRIARDNASPLNQYNSLKPNALPSGMYPHLVDRYMYQKCYIRDSKAGQITELNKDLYVGSVRCTTDVKAI